MIPILDDIYYEDFYYNLMEEIEEIERIIKVNGNLKIEDESYQSM